MSNQPARASFASSTHLAALALVSLVAIPTAYATVMIEVPMDRLVAESDLVVHGRIARTGDRLVANADGHLEPHTVAFVHVLEVLRGVPTSDELVVDEIGGRSQGREMRIAGTPEYRRGEEVVLFLRALPDGTYRTYAMAQGHFEVLPALLRDDRVAVRDTRAISMARWSSGSMQVDHGQLAEMPLAAFLDYLRQLAAMTTETGTTSATGGAR